MAFLAHLVVSAALLLVVAWLIDDVEVDGALAALLAALVLGLVNGLVRPLAVLLTFPLTLLTFGLFLLVVNALMLKLAAAVVPGFRIRGFLPALLAAILLALLNLGVDRIAGGSL